MFTFNRSLCSRELKPTHRISNKACEMGVYIKNANTSVGLSLTALKLVGFWAPSGLSGDEKRLYNLYTVLSFMSLLGLYCPKDNGLQGF